MVDEEHAAGDNGIHGDRPRPVRSARSGATPAHYDRRRGGNGSRTGGSASGVWGKLCAVSGTLAVLAGAALVCRAVAPAAVPVLSGVSLHSLMLMGVALAVLTVVLVVVARVRASSRNRHTRSTVWGILAIVLSLMLVGGGLAVNTIFPDGIIQPPVRDEAPVGDAAAMRQGVESAFGACVDGWQTVDASSYPGVESIDYCIGTRVAYATFDGDSMIGLYTPAIRSKASELLSQHSGEAGDTQWASLAGGRWIIVGNKEGAERLHRAWGGTLTDISFHR